MQSGYASYRWRSAADAEAIGDQLARAVGCSDVRTAAECLRSKTRDQILTALPVGSQQILERGVVDWSPVVDGLEIPDQPRELYARGEFTRVPLLLGATADDGWPFVDRSFPSGLSDADYAGTVTREFAFDGLAVLDRYTAAQFPTSKDALARLTGDAEYVCEARRVARFVQKTGTPVFPYSFEYQVEAIDAGRASHGLETNFLFGNNFAAPSNHVLNAGDQALFSAMSGYWARFAATGDPGDAGSPVRWPRFTQTNGATSDRYLVLDTTIGEASFLRDEYCNFWDHYFFRSLLDSVPASRP